jgi:FkbM family methyltransferase
MLQRFRLMDVWILKETILDRQYEVAGTALQNNWTIIDIGAAMGDFSIWAARQIPKGRLIAIEPYPPYVSLLRVNIEKNKVINAEVYDGAISSSEGLITLNKSTTHAVQNSTVIPASSLETLKVKSITLRELLKQFDIQKCDYLKMDCEGAEYEILFSTPLEIFAKIDRICMEVHDNLTQYSHKEMLQFLEQKGYVTRFTPNAVHKELGFIYAEKSTLKKDD